MSPANATNKEVEWISDNKNVVKVDSTGKVTAVGEGEATVTVKTKDGTKVAICKVKVKNPIVSIKENKLIGENRYKK